jgi:arylsulfatase A-like enzyme
VASASQPNVVLFFVDDLGWTDWQHDAALNPTGSPVYETPNMLRLAQSGVVFSQGYSASPVCSSSRASLLTGKTTARTNYTYLAGGNGGSSNTSPTLMSPVSTAALPASEITLAESLGSLAGGYQTGFIGKWHVGAGPTSHGFGYNIAGGNSGCPCGDGFFAGADGGWSNMPGILPGSGYPADAYLSDVLAGFAENYIQQRAASNNPFFLTFAPYLVHVPLEAPAPLVGKYTSKIANLTSQSIDLHGHDNATYAAMIEKVDEALGRVLDRLDDPDGNGDLSDSIRENTIILLASDNGGLTVSELGFPRATSVVPLREGKGSLFEGGIRSPLIASWMGNASIEQGSTSDARVSGYDIYPTLLEMTGLAANAAVPRNSDMDGVSFAAALEGEALNRGYQYWHLPHRSNQDQRGQEQGIPFDGGAFVSAIRDDQFKMIYQYETATYELYDLINDIGETSDLVTTHSAKAFELSAALHSYLTKVGASTPINKFSGLTVDLPSVLWPTVQGDFDGLNGIDPADWMQLKAAFGSSVSQLPLITGYATGDINLDGKIDRFDIAHFKMQYNLLNGLGAFESLVVSVPEPATTWSAAIAAICYVFRQRRSQGRTV